MGKLKAGMVGGGQGAFIGPVHRMALGLDGEAELAAGAFSSDAEKSKKSGQALYLDQHRVYADWRRMIEGEKDRPRGERIDFVVIVTPTGSHYEIVRAFLEAGFNVVCDKPLTTGLEDARRLEKLAAANGLVLALTHNYTGYPMVKQARHLVLAGKLGKINKVIVEYPQGWLSGLLTGGSSAINIWRMNPAVSGKSCCVADIGIHAENLNRYITGLEIAELCADVSAFIPGNKLDDDASVLLRFKGGAKGVLYCSQISSGEENGLTIRIYGDKGGLEWRQEDPNYLVLKDPRGFKTVLSKGNPAVLCKAAVVAGRLPFGHPDGFIEAFANVYREAFRAIRAQRAGRKIPPCDFPTARDGVIGLAFIEAVLESAASAQKWTKMRA